MSVISNEWLPVPESYRALRAALPEFFPSEGAWRRHLKNRERNGLVARDAVRVSPIGGQILVNPARVRSWVLAEPQASATAA